jgi:hypothetical protein
VSSAASVNATFGADATITVQSGAAINATIGNSSNVTFGGGTTLETSATTHTHLNVKGLFSYLDIDNSAVFTVGAPMLLSGDDASIRYRLGAEAGGFADPLPVLTKDIWFVNANGALIRGTHLANANNAEHNGKTVRFVRYPSNNGAVVELRDSVPGATLLVAFQDSINVETIDLVLFNQRWVVAAATPGVLITSPGM